jgi:hypothetical protein
MRRILVGSTFIVVLAVFVLAANANEFDTREVPSQ